MKLLEAYHSGFKFKHKNWAPDAWFENDGKALNVFIGQKSLMDHEIYGDDWVVLRPITKMLERDTLGGDE